MRVSTVMGGPPSPRQRLVGIPEWMSNGERLQRQETSRYRPRLSDAATSNETQQDSRQGLAAAGGTTRRNRAAPHGSRVQQFQLMRAWLPASGGEHRRRGRGTQFHSSSPGSSVGAADPLGLLGPAHGRDWA